MTHTYKITGMTCNGCKASVEKGLNALQNVTSTSVNLEKGEATVNMSSPISVEKLQDALSHKFSISEKKNIFTSTSTSTSTKSELQQLKPLFLIFGYIITASVLLHYKAWTWNAFMLDFMGLFYIVFSFFKLLDLKGFPASFTMYDPLAKVFKPYALIYPFIELTLGILFLMRIQIPLALVITLLVLGITTVGVTRSLLGKQTIRCACLGTALKLPMTKATFIENTIMIVMAVLLLLNTYSL